MFVRYNGRDNPKYTVGKVYLADQKEIRDTCDSEHMYVTNDKGAVDTFSIETQDFEILSQIYGVWIGKQEQYPKGTVLLIDEANKDYFHIEGDGYQKHSNFELLDKTNLVIGMMVLNKVTGQWEEVVMLNGAEWIGTKTAEKRPPTDFKFSIVDNSVSANPFVICIDDTGVYGITAGKLYSVRAVHGDKLTIVDDEGSEKEYLASRFEQ